MRYGTLSQLGAKPPPDGAANTVLPRNVQCALAHGDDQCSPAKFVLRPELLALLQHRPTEEQDDAHLRLSEWRPATLLSRSRVPGPGGPRLPPRGPDPGPRFRPDRRVLGIQPELALNLQVLATTRSLVELASPSLREGLDAGLRAVTAMITRQLPRDMSLKVEPEKEHAT